MGYGYHELPKLMGVCGPGVIFGCHSKLEKPLEMLEYFMQRIKEHFSFDTSFVQISIF